LGVPVFVLTHTVPQEWVYEGSPFTFVTDGLESAVEQAKAVAGDKDVGVIGASLVQQCIRARLIDEIHLDLVPVLLGGGVRLFDHLGTVPTRKAGQPARRLHRVLLSVLLGGEGVAARRVHGLVLLLVQVAELRAVGDPRRHVEAHRW
jgi:hypothetical protein